MSSPKSSSKNFDCESGDEVEDIPESSGGGAGEGGEGNKSSSTTDSYSSVPDQQQPQYEEDCDILKDINGNGSVKIKLSPTDSESFTTSEQLTQRFVDIYVAERRKE